MNTESEPEQAPDEELHEFRNPALEKWLEEFRPKVKKSKKMLTLQEASKLTGLKAENLLDYGIKGDLSFCIAIDKTKTLLWVTSKDYLIVRDPTTSPERKVLTSYAMRLNKSDRTCIDQDNVEWVSLSKEDCKRLAVLGRHRQSIFESGWKFDGDSGFTSVIPRYISISGEKVPGTLLPHNWTFRVFQRDESHLQDFDFNYMPKNEIELDISPDNIFCPSSELESIIEKLIHDKNKDNPLKISSSKKSISEVKHTNMSKDLLFMMLGSYHFWKKFNDTLKKDPDAKFSEQSEIIRYFTKKNKEAPESHDAMSKRRAEESARIIMPWDDNPVILNVDEGDRYLTPKLWALLEVSYDLWKDADLSEEAICPTDSAMIKRLVGQYNFAPSSAEIAVNLITPIRRKRGKKPKPANDGP